MRIAGMFDMHEFFKRIKRLCDGNFSYRKILFFIIIFGASFLYLGPWVSQWFFSNHTQTIEAYEEHCIDERLAGFYFESVDYNVNILHYPAKNDENPYLPYVGNGYFGIPIVSDSSLYIKNGRTLSLRIPWQPLIYHAATEDSVFQEATVVQYTTGITHRYQCLREGYYIGYQYYAHQELEGIFVQDIKISNPSSVSEHFSFDSQKPYAFWENFVLDPISIQVDRSTYDLKLLSGYVILPNKKIIAIAILYQVPPNIILLKRGPTKLEYLTSIKYSEPILLEQYKNEKDTLQKQVINNMRQAISKQQKGLKDSHVQAWQDYWQAGFRISDSKAKGAINGHKINSTIYYILSQIPKAPLNVEKSVLNNEGCYHGHHTLDALRLWNDTKTIESVNSIVDKWLITLDKQGCHRLMTGNPSAVMQAILLSLGGFRFTNQHLEFNIDPEFLHRDFLFRRIKYGNATHLNITVTVNEDNKAVLGVAVDKSDSKFFGCQAGCEETPVQLSQSYTNFPVKITKPLTAILFITSDQQHMQDLQNALHVKEVNEAPAHDHQVLALHKHGHQLGGLPTFFWVSICFLIIVFHLFLFKLIINEYWDQKDRPKIRYNKLSNKP